jgi:two-component system response regulator (stage 0 sporulation protein F)
LIRPIAAPAFAGAFFICVQVLTEKGRNMRVEREYSRIRVRAVLSHGGKIMEKKKLLIVDDQVGIRILLLEVFSTEGYETFQAANGRTALEIVRAHLPDLVLLDMKIPGMDGLEILKKIKELDRRIKVIMMTAYGELDMIKEATDLGALMHFTKPFDIDEMRLAVNMQMGEGPASRIATGS